MTKCSSGYTSNMHIQTMVTLTTQCIQMSRQNWFSSEPWMKFRRHRYQCPWLLWYTISVRISSWFVTSFISDTFMRFSWWRHQMETFSALLALCAGNSPVPVNSPHKGQWRGALMFSLICTWINAWVNNREAGDLRGHRAHYDVIVMESWFPVYWT